jgi:pimeloyl-ACP methyl ester carboxylesterase
MQTTSSVPETAHGQYFRQDFLETDDGAPIYFQVQGEGEPGIVLCDGLGCDGFVWKYLLPKLKTRHRVVRWHYRGHGQSGLARESDRVGMHYTCEDLAAVMDAAGMSQAVLFGHSMGVQVALEFHRRFRSRVLGLALICGSSGNPLDTFHDGKLLKLAFPYLHKVVERFPKTAATVTKVALNTDLALDMALIMELNQKLMKRQDLMPYFEHLAAMDPVVFVRTLKSLSEHSALDHLPHVDVPTLVIGAALDKFTPVRLSRQMAETIPGATYVLCPEASHTAPLEQPELVSRAVDRFLSGLEKFATVRHRDV